MFQVDYEISVLKAIEETFLAAGTKGWNFHYTQALYRKVQSLGMKKVYDDDVGVKRFVRSLMAFSLIPADKIDDAWVDVNAESPRQDHACYDQVNLFKDYFVRTWLENPNIHPRSLWNHFG